MKSRFTTKAPGRLKGESGSLSKKRIAIRVADGFEQEELVEPRNALKNVGTAALVVSPVKRMEAQLERSAEFIPFQFERRVDAPQVAHVEAE